MQFAQSGTRWSADEVVAGQDCEQHVETPSITKAISISTVVVAFIVRSNAFPIATANQGRAWWPIQLLPATSWEVCLSIQGCYSAVGHGAAQRKRYEVTNIGDVDVR